MLINNKSIAIVGGGPGGLTLARLLQIKGADVKVYERDTNRDARLIGSPLDMHDDSGMKAIKAMELLDAFKQYFRPGADRMLIVDEKAVVHFDDHDGKPDEDFDNPHFRPEIDRAPLRDMLLESLETGTVIWDSHFLSMEKEKDGWNMHFKNGLTAYADIVIAADGANSKIRPYITDIKAFYTGIIMLEGNIHHAKEVAPTISSLIKDGKIMAFGNEQDILLGQKGNGDLGYYVSFKAPQHWATETGIDFNSNGQVLEWFKQTYPDWSPIWYELFKNAATPYIPRPIYCMPLDQDWKALSNVTMIGDAAHVMPPFAGEGANMAMLDAVELSDAITSADHNTLEEAIGFYEVDMRKRASAAAKESLENGERMHAKDALETMLGFFAQH